MGWVVKERRGPAWKHGWTEQMLSSISAPPLQLLFLFGIICLLLLLSSYSTYKREMHNTVVSLKLLMLFLPLILFLVARYFSHWEWLVVPYARTKRELKLQSTDLPWRVLLLVLLLLLLLSYQSYFHSLWSPGIWKSY